MPWIRAKNEATTGAFREQSGRTTQTIAGKGNVELIERAVTYIREWNTEIHETGGDGAPQHFQTA